MGRLGCWICWAMWTQSLPLAPRLSVFSTCGHLIEQIPGMVHNPNRPEDVLKVDVDDDGNGGDDAYDAAGMG